MNEQQIKAIAEAILQELELSTQDAIDNVEDNIPVEYRLAQAAIAQLPEEYRK